MHKINRVEKKLRSFMNGDNIGCYKVMVTFQGSGYTRQCQSTKLGSSKLAHQLWFDQRKKLYLKRKNGKLP